ncbi:MAG: carbamoyltransferase [Planctomycetota bacterium]|nr:carbamoyltransferase [Planctomycetota bacterium]
MRVLGISPLDKDATASIVEDGKILYAAGEERFSRIKQHKGFPHESLAKGLEVTGTKPEDVEEVSYAFLTWDQEVASIHKSLEEDADVLHVLDCAAMRRLLKEADRRQPERPDAVHGLTSPEQVFAKGGLKKLAYHLLSLNTTISRAASKYLLGKWVAGSRAAHRHWQADLEAGLRRFGLQDKLKRYEHHLSHAANSYLNSGFERALIVTIDGYGTGLAGSISLGEGTAIKRLANVRYPHSLGTYYEMVTSSLGYNPSRHAGKIVGLAAYGDPERLAPALLQTFERTPGAFRIHQAQNSFISRYLATRYPMIDVAAAYQHVLEVVVQEWVQHWIKQTGADAVALSGGVTANVKMNQRIFEVEGVKRVFVYPNMGDGGCGSGVAVLRSMGAELPGPFESAYLGPEYGDAEMRAALDEAGLQYDAPSGLEAQVAKRVHSGEVVARFDGRMEYGPRALGNRSILYHAREPDVNQWLNKRLGRTEFMPFAPVTLYEAREKCYRNMSGAEHTAEFMTITFDCTPFMGKSCPAAVHVDGTARPQLVRREVNPGYYGIVEEYEKLSGIPCLINTSFNMHEEPIVCTPRDAVRAFLEGHLDCLAIGSYVVPNPEAGKKPREAATASVA